MFSNILVPLDGSAHSNTALPLARTVAQATNGTITLLRVVNPYDTPKTMAQTSSDLQRVATELAAGGPQVKTVVRESEDVSAGILEEVRRQGADLVIMRTHGRVGIERAVLGSVTQRVLASSPVPVMLLRPGGRRITEIKNLVVPIDGSPGGTLALGAAVQLSRATGASMHLLEVLVSVPSWIYPADANGGMPYYDPVWDEEALASARMYVDSIVKRLRAANIDADGEAHKQPVVADSIVQAADTADADLIVMSTRALTGSARALLGSTADAVVRAAHCPVLLIHRARATGDTPIEFAPDAAAETPLPTPV